MEWKYTTCGYCSTGCSIEVGLDEGGEGAAAMHEQNTKFGRTYLARNIELMSGLVLAAILKFIDLDGVAALVLWSSAAIIILLTAIWPCLILRSGYANNDAGCIFLA